MGQRRHPLSSYAYSTHDSHALRQRPGGQTEHVDTGRDRLRRPQHPATGHQYSDTATLMSVIRPPETVSPIGHQTG